MRAAGAWSLKTLPGPTTVGCYAGWDAVDENLNSVNPDQAPLDMSPWVHPGVNYLSVTLAVNSATVNPTMHLVHFLESADATDEYVLGVQSGLCTHVPNNRDQELDGAGGAIICTPITFPVYAFELGRTGSKVALLVVDLNTATFVALVAAQGHKSLHAA